MAFPLLLSKPFCVFPIFFALFARFFDFFGQKKEKTDGYDCRNYEDEYDANA